MSMIYSGGRRRTVSRELQRERDETIALEEAKTDLTMLRLANMAKVGQTAIVMGSIINRTAETAASVVPEERGRTDALADIVAANLAAIVTEQGRQAR